MNIPQQLLIQLILILLNAFFAATEIAIISLNENKLRRRADDGDKKAGKMLKFVEEPTGFLSTIQIGITLAGFLGSAFAADNFSDLLTSGLVKLFRLSPESAGVLDTVSVIIITIILSYFTLVLGELVPKRIAMRDPEKLARFVCGIISALEKVLKPIVWFMTVSTDAVLRLFGIKPDDEKESVSEDDIRLLIDVGEEKGAIEPEEKEMIENIFEFNNTTAGEIMIHRTSVTFLPADFSHAETIKLIKDTEYSRFPVYEANADNIIGILISKDYLIAAAEDKDVSIKELVQPATFVHEAVRADVLFREMQQKRVHMAVVVDEFGGTAGIVTLEDLIEEIVGNIYDESDEQNKPDITKLEDNLWRIAGSTQLDDINDSLDIDIDCNTEEYKTLSGLFFSEMSAIPDDGTTPGLSTHGLNIKAELIKDRHLEWALVSKILPEKTTEEA